ncbi:MAG: S-layer homology domain-containing protein [Bacillota bacterium]
MTASLVSLPRHPLQVTLPYSPGSNPARLGVYRYNEEAGAWDYRGGRADTQARTITFTAPSFSEYAVLEYARSFADLAAHWAKDDVEMMAARQIARGGGDGSRFDPAGVITRAQFAALLVRALGLAESQGPSPFADVAPSAWYARSVSTAAHEGLILGSDGQFRPDAPITRQEMAVMIKRTAAKYGMPPTDPDQALARLHSMADGPAVSAWAREAAALALANGWMRGRDGGGLPWPSTPPERRPWSS